MEDQRLEDVIVILRTGNKLARQQAVETLARLAQLGIQPTRALKHIVGALSDAHVMVRHTAAVALGQVGDNSVLPALKSAQIDKNPFVRHAALTALDQVTSRQNEKAAAVVHEKPTSVEDETHLDLRAATVVDEEPTLVDDQTHQDLVVNSQTGDRFARQQAVEALARQIQLGIKPKLSLKCIVEALKDPDAIVRQAAAVALGQVGDNNVLVVLRRAQHDRSPSVRKAATVSVNQIVYRREKRIDALVQRKSKSAKSLLKLLRSEDRDVQLEAVKALRTITRGKQKAILPLLDLLETTDEEFCQEIISTLNDIAEDCDRLDGYLLARGKSYKQMIKKLVDTLLGH
jgi:HEAT repeat protein